MDTHALGPKTWLKVKVLAQGPRPHRAAGRVGGVKPGQREQCGFTGERCLVTGEQQWTRAEEGPRQRWGGAAVTGGVASGMRGQDCG